MKFRPHRGSLDDAMRLAVEIEPEDLIATLQKELWEPVSPKDVHVKPYHYDRRIDWDTHMVLVHGQIVGFTDGPWEPTT